MAILITASQVSKSFGIRPLFTDINFVVAENDRIGLIGPNGAGKSTLLKAMAGKLEVDSGEISCQRGLKISMLEQTPSLPLDRTVEEAIAEVLPKSERIEQMARIQELLSKLHLEPWAHRKISELSGGWRKRVALAKELVIEPQVLLLDEPTNHLDIESIVWLESFIEKASFAVVTITHDRLFLQNVTHRILELDRRNPKGLLAVDGDYATYLERKEELLANQQVQETKLKNKLRRETEWLRRGPKARSTKQQARIQSAGVLKDEVSELEERNQNRIARISFQSNDRKPKRLLEAKSITKAIPGKILFEDLSVFIGPGSRIGLLGSNGCGKSTLIRLLLGESEPDSGIIIRSEHLKVAYFEQNREALDLRLTLRKTLCPHGDEVNYRGKLVHIHGYLDRFLFRKEQFDMTVANLSGGEQSRILIAQLMLKECNVLVMDEPTNDLDIETLDLLQDCLSDFEGAVILVTHDRYFLDQVATQILAFPFLSQDEGKIVSFADLSQWESWHQNRLRDSKRDEKIKTSDTSKAAQEKKKRLGFNETRELAEMEAKIHKTEAKLKELEADSTLEVNLSNSKKLSEMYAQMAATQTEIERLYARWSELEAMTK